MPLYPASEAILAAFSRSFKVAVLSSSFFMIAWGFTDHEITVFRHEALQVNVQHDLT